MRGAPLGCVLCACVDGPPVDRDACARQAVEALPALWAGWRAPDEEHAVWEALAEGLTGRALTDTYVRTWSSRAAMAEEGTSVRPLGHDLERVEVAEGPGCEVDATWSLRVVVGHRGHRHLKVLRQRASLLLEDARVARVRSRDLQTVQQPYTDPMMDDPRVGPGYVPVEALLEAGWLDTDRAP